MKLQDKLREQGITPDALNSSDMDPNEDDSKTKELNEEIDKLKQRCQELEEMLKKLKRNRPTAVSGKDGVDFMVIIEELRDEIDGDLRGLRNRVDKVEDAQGKTEFRSQNNESRIDSLERQVKEHNDKIMSMFRDMKSQKNNFEDLEAKIKELREKVNEKVDNDIFDQEINCKFYEFIQK